MVAVAEVVAAGGEAGAEEAEVVVVAEGEAEEAAEAGGGGGGRWWWGGEVAGEGEAVAVGAEAVVVVAVAEAVAEGDDRRVYRRRCSRAGSPLGLPDERTDQAGLRRPVRERRAAGGRLRVLADVDPDHELGPAAPPDRVLHVRLHRRQVVAEGHQVELVDVGGARRPPAPAQFVITSADTNSPAECPALAIALTQLVIAEFGGPWLIEVLVLDVEVDSVEPVRGREADEVLDELRPVRVIARGRPVVVACAADRDDRLDPGVRVHSRNPGRDVDVRDVALVEAGPVRSRQVEQDQLVEVAPRQTRRRYGSPAEILAYHDTTCGMAGAEVAGAEAAVAVEVEVAEAAEVAVEAAVEVAGAEVAVAEAEAGVAVAEEGWRRRCGGAAPARSATS